MQRVKSTMTGFELEVWLQKNKWTVQQAADRLGISSRTLYYYLSDQLPIPATVANLISALALAREDSL